MHLIQQLTLSSAYKFSMLDGNGVIFPNDHTAKSDSITSTQGCSVRLATSKATSDFPASGVPKSATSCSLPSKVPSSQVNTLRFGGSIA